MEEPIVHPWRDIDKYVEARTKEALYEFELAEEFLKNGLYRNAAGRAFQGWKAVLAVLAANSRSELVSEFRGLVRLRERVRVEAVDYVIAIMPTTRMKKVATLLSRKYGSDVVLLTELALDLHEFQYNGLDREGLLSRYIDLDMVRQDIAALIEGGRRIISSLANTQRTA
ncbi:PaREP1 family protein [Vulcanisaeta sp. JCM 14467]|uniref:PaREP1 family protein n=1 Tax=Vulcanisaeta sp. JCM 14467 TaxID=1295370 RepID=UPI0006D29214|nr:PaREP1 family protein [Vulcanisaeta sp. JCM 14467]